jgi:hypothetical protein
MLLQNQIYEEIKQLPPDYQKEVLDFVLFIKNRMTQETDNDYLTKNTDSKQAIIEGLQTPLSACDETLER